MRYALALLVLTSTAHGEPGDTIRAPADASANEISHVMKENAKTFRKCYETERAKNPSLGGKVVLAFAIGPTGVVTTAKVKSTTMKSRPVETCLVATVERLTFPPAAKSRNVVFPLIFTAG